VRDSGVGIAPEQLSHIFEEFYQIGVSPNSSRDGYGLGLSIVQRIARLLDLRIEVTSQPGKGSTFAFELPVATAARADTVAGVRPAPAEPGARTERRVLLVEDEPGVRNAMRMLLRIEGYQVIAAATAEEALQMLADDEQFDILVTDYHLEGSRTGTEVVAAARARLGDAMKAILVTGDTSSAIRELESDGSLRITSKPVNSRELLALIREMLGG
jgi:CheY-like chemotaxis protein